MKIDSIGGSTEMVQGIPFPMGVNKVNEGWNFSIEVPSGAKCAILFYYKNKKLYRRLEIPGQFRIGNVFSVLLKNFNSSRFYYKFEINGKEQCDPYASWMIGHEKWGEYVEEKDLYCGFFEDSFDWEDDHVLELPFSKVIRYMIHPRGFTRHRSSKVQYRGTFLGLIEKIPYLKELGINQIELMPAYEFEECETAVSKNTKEVPGKSVSNVQMKTNRTEENADVPERKMNFWGYKNGFYFSPKAAYCATGNPINEFRKCVRELHKNKIEIIMEFYFGNMKNAYFIHECLRFWHIHYHIDGFHLIGSHIPLTVLSSDPVLGKSKILMDEIPENQLYESSENSWNKTFASTSRNFTWHARNFLKGTENTMEEFADSVRKNPLCCAQMNSITTHDGFTLHDLVSYNYKHNQENGENNLDGSDYNLSWNCGIEGISRKKGIMSLRLRQMKNAFAFMLLSQGVPSILAGDEFANSQQGNNNAYCQDNDLSWICWKSPKPYESLSAFLKILIQLRKDHAVFRNEKPYRLMDTISCGYPDMSFHGTMAWHPNFKGRNFCLAIMYCGYYREDDFFYVIYNMDWRKKIFDLPALPKEKKWYFCFDTFRDDFMETANHPVKLENQRQLEVSARTTVVLTGKQEEKKKLLSEKKEKENVSENRETRISKRTKQL